MWVILHPGVGSCGEPRWGAELNHSTLISLLPDCRRSATGTLRYPDYSQKQPFKLFSQIILFQWYRKLTLGIRSGLVAEITLIMWLDSGYRKSPECCKKGLISYSGRPWREHRDRQAWLLMLPRATRTLWGTGSKIIHVIFWPVIWTHSTHG